MNTFRSFLKITQITLIVSMVPTTSFAGFLDGYPSIPSKKIIAVIRQGAVQLDDYTVDKDTIEVSISSIPINSLLSVASGALGGQTFNKDVTANVLDKKGVPFTLRCGLLLNKDSTGNRVDYTVTLYRCQLEDQKGNITVYHSTRYSDSDTAMVAQFSKDADDAYSLLGDFSLWQESASVTQKPVENRLCIPGSKAGSLEASFGP